MMRSNIYTVDIGMGAANNLIYVPMYIFANSNVYRIVRDIDFEYDNEQYPRLIRKLKQLQRQHK